MAIEPQQDLYGCRLLLTTLLVLLTQVDSAFLQPTACRLGGAHVATMSRQQQWPVPNPALVAPAKVNYSFAKIHYPLQSEFTGESIALHIPDTYDGGFKFYYTNNEGIAPEVYRLRRIELRKAAQEPEGMSKVLSHQLEVVLLHEQVGGSYWASVVVPLKVSRTTTYDPVFPITVGANMPQKVGEQEPLLLSSAQVLDLDAYFANGEFLHHWTKLPTTCVGIEADARNLMRSSVLNVGQETYKTLLTSLKNAPEVPPVAAPELAWLINTCSETGACTQATSENLEPAVTAALEIQSLATQEFRERKALMDAAYQELVAGSGNATAILANATAAKTELELAEWKLAGSTRHETQVQKWFDQFKHSTFDSGKSVHDTSLVQPLDSQGGAAASTAPTIDFTTPIADADSKDSAVQPSTPPRSGPSASAGTFLSQLDASDCRALRRSPIDIISALARNPGMASPERSDLLRFDNASTRAPLFAVSALGRMRIQAGEPTALGSVSIRSQKLWISYADIVAPGEHSIDGKVGDAEVQLVHTSTNGEPDVAIALPFRMADTDNSWFGAVLKSKRLRASASFVGQPVSELHEFLRRGSSSDYFRYDGTLTSPPCNATQWFVVQEPGHISKKQFAELLRQVGGVSDDGSLITSVIKPHERFHASLVAFGTTHLASDSVTDTKKHRKINV